MDNQTPKEESWLLVRLVHLIKQFPFVVFCIWMGWRDIQRETRIQEKEAKQEIKDDNREKFDQEQLIYYRNAKQEDLEIKRRELDKSYEKDTLSKQ